MSNLILFMVDNVKRKKCGTCNDGVAIAVFLLSLLASLLMVEVAVVEKGDGDRLMAQLARNGGRSR